MNESGRRVVADLRGVSRPLHVARLLLVADLLRRLLDDGADKPVIVLHGARSSPARDTGLGWAVAIGAVGPGTVELGDPSASLAGPELLVVRRAAASAATEAATRESWQTEEPALAADRLFGVEVVDTSRRATAVLADLHVHLPLAVRLALLRFDYARPAELSAARLHRAEETLSRWRYKVADWVDRPPEHPPDQWTAIIDQALTTELDTAALLIQLRRIEVDHGLPSGAKLALFDQADRVLALDLRHAVAGPHR